MELSAQKKKTAPTVKKTAKKKRTVKKELSSHNILRSAKKKTFPEHITPMLATLVNKPVEDEKGWIYEVKWDGYRALAFLNKGKVELKSRNDKSFNDKFYPVVEELKKLSANVILDGEIIVIDEKGISDFSALQGWRSEADGDLIYYVFDILWYEGKDLAPVPLNKRKELLKALIPGKGIIRISESFTIPGKQFLEMAKKMGLEGIIAKNEGSKYQAGLRTKDWLKIKTNKRQEMVIGGYTMNENSGKPFSSLLVGVYDKDKLVYTGKVGTGFTIQAQKEMRKQFKSLETKKVPFSYTPDINKPSRFRPNPPKARAVWLKPKLVCEVSYAEMTSDGIMRHPSFAGMRTDKNANEIILETETNVTAVSKNSSKEITKKLFRPVSNKDRKTLLNPSEKTQVRKINGHELKFTNLDKVFWPKENVTKRDMLNYYYRMAPYILPYFKDRPQSMNRFPNGIYGESFYQKDITGKAPSWIKTFLYHSNADNRDRNYLVPDSEASILYMASLGCIELNPWNSRVQSPGYPDWCIIDLDPDKNSFNQVIEAALVTKEILDALNVPGYCKTSGSTGLHIYIPLGAKYTYEQSKEFARVIAKLVHHQLPKFTSIERMVKNRGGKMYIDFLQNRPQATVAGPYVLRPKPGAPVSMPLHWEEVKKGLKMTDFNIFNAYDRVKSEGDIFKPVIGKGINLEKIIKNFDK